MKDFVIPIKLLYASDEIVYRKKGNDLSKQKFSVIHAAKYDRLAGSENAIFGSNRLKPKIS
ncbi:MAG: hypothetical protein JWP81_603 [Ferruginibacter sp.]|nr:hypothetical protein [Ferruginibacter sp.]